MPIITQCNHTSYTNNYTNYIGNLKWFLFNSSFKLVKVKKSQKHYCSEVWEQYEVFLKSLLWSQMLHLLDQKYSKNSIFVKYYYDL